MRLFIKNSILFLLPILIYITIIPFILPNLLEVKYGPSTYKQIKFSFEKGLSKNFDLYILGNSRPYRGINPDLFSVSTFNFSHDNDSYNQMYFKLKKILDIGKPQYLIVGVDYFQFGVFSESRNYAYSSFFSNKYLDDYGKSKLYYKVQNHLTNANPRVIYDFWLSEGKRPVLKENGQYLKFGKAGDFDSSRLNYKINPIQKQYFEKILNDCHKSGIEVFLVMMPSRKKELARFTQEQMNELDNYLNEMVEKYNYEYLNYSSSELFSDADFSDITHLNEKGADKFSMTLNERIF